MKWSVSIGEVDDLRSRMRVGEREPRFRRVGFNNLRDVSSLGTVIGSTRR